MTHLEKRKRERERERLSERNTHSHSHDLKVYIQHDNHLNLTSAQVNSDESHEDI